MLKNAPLIAKIGVDTDVCSPRLPFSISVPTRMGHGWNYIYLVYMYSLPWKTGGEPPTPSFPEDSSDCTAPHRELLSALENGGNPRHLLFQKIVRTAPHRTEKVDCVLFLPPRGAPPDTFIFEDNSDLAAAAENEPSKI